MTNGVERSPSTPVAGGLRGAILGGLIALLAKMGLADLSPEVVAGIAAFVGFALTALGKVVRDKLPWVPGFLIPF